MMQIFQFKPLQWMIAALVAILLFMIGTGQFDGGPQVKTPCSEPITFHVGDIDERFSITKEEVIRLMKDVAQVWSDAADTTIIQYDEEGEIALSLVYAEEQQLIDRERQYRDRMENEEFSITALENEYTRMNEEYEQEVQKYDEDSRELQESIDRLNEWVRQKNEQAGFNKEDLKRFERRKAEIDQVKLDLKRTERTLKRKAAELNDKIIFLNSKVEAKNRLVDEYNRQFTGTRKFTQGAYEWTNNSRKINIYHFLDKNELRLVIAHEMGHALGITHVSNPESVMHELMEQQNRRDLELTEEDIRALQSVCMNQLN
ncbi:MAG: matrixin family metalloprotease [Bacteroidetes bacterium]|jgi:chromosome segregation ATPase|nr:matrixin family metalloprotease [Bacteroidota bacterium]